MTGLAGAAEGSVRVVRTSIEVVVALIGYTVGLGAVLCSLAIGPLVQILMPRMGVRLHR
ncbi:hypothetical protein [Kocuria kalidii]|uniref:hypothetical protein n=1 Tax=Kocuria kalidii TaxID=3376283 RepID=UPI0037A5B648